MLQIIGKSLISMEGSALRREKERERRRIRDRERRSSMSIEQRERHLARRRRNYQLRRLKYQNVKTTNPSFSGTNSFKAISETSIAELDLQQNGIMLVGFNHEQESLNPDSITSSSKICFLKDTKWRDNFLELIFFGNLMNRFRNIGPKS